MAWRAAINDHLIIFSFLKIHSVREVSRITPGVTEQDDEDSLHIKNYLITCLRFHSNDFTSSPLVVK